MTERLKERLHKRPGGRHGAEIGCNDPAAVQLLDESGVGLPEGTFEGEVVGVEHQEKHRWNSGDERAVGLPLSASITTIAETSVMHHALDDAPFDAIRRMIDCVMPIGA